MKRLWLASVLCMFVLVAGAASAQADDEACMYKGGSLTDGVCVLSASAEIKVDYPLELAQNEIVASTIDPFIQQSKDSFLQVLSGPFIPAPGPYVLDISYEIVSHSDTVVSLVFAIYDFTGGAHGNTYFQTFTFDLAAGTVITLSDIFTDTAQALEVIAPLAEADLVQQFTDAGAPDFDADWLHEGTSPDAMNYVNFALDATDLVFYFPPYQVAAYAFGSQTVRIPLADLSTVLAPGFAS